MSPTEPFGSRSGRPGRWDWSLVRVCSQTERRVRWSHRQAGGSWDGERRGRTSVLPPLVLTLTLEPTSYEAKSSNSAFSDVPALLLLPSSMSRTEKKNEDSVTGVVVPVLTNLKSKLFGPLPAQWRGRAWAWRRRAQAALGRTDANVDLAELPVAAIVATGIGLVVSPIIGNEQVDTGAVVRADVGVPNDL